MRQEDTDRGEERRRKGVERERDEVSRQLMHILILNCYSWAHWLSNKYKLNSTGVCGGEGVLVGQDVGAIDLFWSVKGNEVRTPLFIFLFFFFKKSKYL